MKSATTLPEHGNDELIFIACLEKPEILAIHGVYIVCCLPNSQHTDKIAKRTLATMCGYAAHPEEEAAAPPPDELTGRWVPLDEVATIRNVSKGTLADYRTQGTKDADGLSGVDSMGYHWRRSNSKAATEYFILDGDSD